MKCEKCLKKEIGCEECGKPIIKKKGLLTIKEYFKILQDLGCSMISLKFNYSKWGVNFEIGDSGQYGCCTGETPELELLDTIWHLTDKKLCPKKLPVLSELLKMDLKNLTLNKYYKD